MGRNCSPSTSLAPGFRFHPTDEELVWYYLRRKVSGKPFRLDAISEIDIYKVEPSDLPGLSKLKTRDLEWYFFSALDRKYGNGSRTNRATNEGYWKTTGKDRPVYHRSRVVGMKKTLVYHKGRAPRGDRSNWVMHEYKINDKVLEKAGFSPDGYVLCRVFQKSGTGPKNGEQYGAPLVEEEWEDSGEVLVPTEVSFEDPYADDDACIQQNGLDPVVQLPAFAPCPVSFDHADSNNYFEGSQDVIGNDQISVGETEDKFSSGALDGQKLHDCVPDGSNACFVKNEHMVKPYDSGVLTLDDLFFDAPDAPVDDDGSYLDASKLNPHDFGIYESAWDDLGIDFASYDPLLNDNSLSELMGNNVDNIVSTKQNVINETWQMPSASQQLPEIGDDGNALSTNCTMEVSKTQPSNSDTQSPCLTWASRLMLDIPTPPSYASELPSKDLAAHLSAAVRSSTSVHLTAGMIRIRDMPIGVNGSGLQWSFDKTGNVNVLLSFDLPQAANPVRLEPLTSFLSKASTATSRGWLCFIFFIVFVFGFTIKFGTCIYAK